VLGSITKLVNCKEQIVLSLVRLETIKKPRDFFRESLATSTYATFEITGGFAEGKMDTISREVSKASYGNSSHFERGSEILNCVNCMLCQAAWKRFSQFELVPFVNAIRIRLDDVTAWCSLEINPSAPFKIGKVFIRPLESES
jgi:hypothetical protein